MNRYFDPITPPARPPEAERTARESSPSPVVYATLVALFTGLIVWSPASGDISTTVFITGLSSVALALTESARGAAGGGSEWPRGGRRIALAGIASIVILAIGASFWAVAMERTTYSFALALVAAVVVFVGTLHVERRRRAPTP